MKFQTESITYFITITCLFALTLNAFLIYMIKPRFLWRSTQEERAIPLRGIIATLILFIVSFFLGLMSYIMKLFNGFVL